MARDNNVTNGTVFNSAGVNNGATIGFFAGIRHDKRKLKSD